MSNEVVYVNLEQVFEELRNRGLNPRRAGGEDAQVPRPGVPSRRGGVDPSTPGASDARGASKPRNPGGLGECSAWL